MNRSRLILVILIGCLVFSLFNFLWGTLPELNSNQELVLGEGFLWMETEVFLSETPLYQPISSTELLVVPHTPLYIIVTSFFTNLTGNTLFAGRLVSILAGIGLCLISFLIGRKLSGSSYIGIVAGLLVVSTYVFKFLTPIYRMDTLGVMFSFLGLYFVIKSEGRGKWLYLSILAFLAAIFTKQFYISGPIAVFLYLWFRSEGSFKESFKYGLAFLGSLLGGLVIAGFLTGWELIYHNFIYLVMGSAFGWPAFVGHLRKLFFYHMPLFIGCLGYLVTKFLRLKLSLQLGPLSWYLLLTSVVVLLTIGKVGSSFHYGFEIVVCLCIIGSLLLQKGLEIFETKEIGLSRVLLGSIIPTLVILQIVGLPLGHGFLTYEYQTGSEVESKKVVDYISEMEGPIFTDVHGLVMASSSRKDWDRWEPAILYRGNFQEREGKLGWDQSVILDRLESGYYSSIIVCYDIIKTWSGQLGNKYLTWVYQEKTTPEIARAMLNNYTFKERTSHLGSNMCPYRVYIYEYNDK